MASGSSRLGTRAWPGARLDARLLVGLGLVAVALVGGVTYADQLRVTAPVVVAARPLPAGHVIAADDLALSEARLEGALAALALGAGERSTLVGRTTAQPIPAGALVLREALGDGPVLGAGEVAVTVAVGADSVFGRLRRGDLVAVLGTTAPGQPQSRTEVLLERASVYHVAAETTRVSLGGEGAGGDARIANVTLVVPRADVGRLTHALVNGRLTLALAPHGDAPTGSGGAR